MKLIALLLKYYFEPIDWNFDMLTDTERNIIKTPERLQQLHEFSTKIKEQV